MSDKAAERQSVQLSQGALERIAAHAEQCYPHECFGFLLGRFDGRTIQATHAGRNVAVSRPHDRYEMDHEEFIQVERDADQWGGTVIGFYHSHPDGAAVPSAYDRERAVEGYLYLIVPVVRGRAGTARLWQVEAGDGPFLEMTPVAREAEEADSCPY